MRKLATIRQISEILPIPNADAIECAVVDGWKVVIKKGEYNVGDLAVYCEIDSWIPTELAAFLSKGKEPREYNGVKGERLRTVKLRGQISQGLLLPISFCVEKMGCTTQLNEGDEVTEWLNIQKWEAPVHASLAGTARGNFPSFIPKTDQERVQNCKRDLGDWIGLDFEITEKLDGTSCTVYYNPDLIQDEKDPTGVCSRNLDLKDTEGNTYWTVAKRFGLHDILISDGRALALQGEIIGQGIQGNQYGLTDHQFYVFDIYDIKEGKYFTPVNRREFCQRHNLRHVPVLMEAYELTEANVDKYLDMAEGFSYINNSDREGVVFKCNTDPSISFKAISNRWLLNEK